MIEGCAEDPDDDFVGFRCGERDGDTFEALRWLDEIRCADWEKRGDEKLTASTPCQASRAVLPSRLLWAF